MSKISPKRKLFPSWDMPSDPVKALWWFMHWLLKLLVRFFWLPIIVMVIYEVIANAHFDDIGNILVVGFITLAIGVGVWAVLYVVLQLVNFGLRVSRVISDANQAQQNMSGESFSDPYRRTRANDKVVEGSLTEIHNEEQKQ